MKETSSLIFFKSSSNALQLSSFYDKTRALGKNFDAMVTEVFESFNSFNAYLERRKPYSPIGRLQNETESDELSKKIKLFLTEHGVTYRTYAGDIQGYDVLVEDILKALATV